MTGEHRIFSMLWATSNYIATHSSYFLILSINMSLYTDDYGGTADGHSWIPPPLGRVTRKPEVHRRRSLLSIPCKSSQHS